TLPSRSSPTRVAAPSEISSMPSRPHTTRARSAPSSCSTRAWMPTRSGWNTPIRMLGAPAGLVSGPRMLKMVRTPISRRTGATTFIAGWWMGAYMKPMPVRSRQAATCSGCSSILAPSASSTSAAPELEETLRPPCLATRAPAAAATNIEQVEMLKVREPSPPVPTMSTRWVRSATSTLRENSRITSAAPAISPTVSFLTRRPVRMAAVITGDTSPRMICRIRSTISSWKISRCSMVRCRASWGVMLMAWAVVWGTRRVYRDGARRPRPAERERAGGSRAGMAGAGSLLPARLPRKAEKATPARRPALRGSPCPAVAGRASVLEVAAQALEGLQLGGDLGQALLRLGHVHRLAAAGQRALGLFLGLAHRRLVDVLGADGGVGQHGHHLRLHLEDAAGDGEVQLGAVGQRDHHLARLEPGDQRRMTRRDAQLAQLAGGHDQGGLAVEDLLLGADDVATDGAHAASLCSVGGEDRAQAIFLAFSTASSMVPTM